MQRMGTLCTLWECKLVQRLWKTAQRFLKKVVIIELYNAAIPVLGIHVKEKKNHYLKEVTVFPCSLQHCSQQPKETACVSQGNEQIKKMQCIQQVLKKRHLIQHCFVLTLMRCHRNLPLVLYQLVYGKNGSLKVFLPKSGRAYRQQ